MEQLKNIERCLISTVQSQLGDLKKTNAKELGEVVDMIKDLEEAMYYCSIIDAMEHTSNEESKISYYNEPHYHMENDTKPYTPYMEYAPYMMRDKEWREERLPDRSYYSRKMYMEGKQTGMDDQKSMKELEHYMKDLSEELTEMIQSATPEEKQVLSNKLSYLAAKIK